MSTRSTAARTAPTSAAVPDSVRMSPTTAWQRPLAPVITPTVSSVCPASNPCTRTIAPSAARTRAMPAPVPRYDPVTNATLPSRPRSIVGGVPPSVDGETLLRRDLPDHARHAPDDEPALGPARRLTPDADRDQVALQEPS